jgi:hypothetical protein
VCDTYIVNPPLVRAVFSLPVVLTQDIREPVYPDVPPAVRTEFQMGREFAALNRDHFKSLVGLARITKSLFWILLIWLAAHWAGTTGSRASGLATAVLIGTCPNLLAWSATLTADVPCAAMTLLAMWCVRVWLRRPDATSACLTGATWGLAILAKSTAVILAIPIVILAVVQPTASRTRQLGQMLLGVVATLHVINSGYGYHGVFQRADDIKTVSSLSQSVRSSFEINDWLSRVFQSVRVPVPEVFIQGMDLQWHDFEKGKWSYLRGEHKFGGWWYWYLYALLVKTPVGTIGLFLIALGWSAWRLVLSWRGRRADPRSDASPSSGLQPPSPPQAGEKGHGSATRLPENLILLLPAVCLFVLVSSQTGFSIHLRYILPCYPFVFIWISQVFSPHAGLPAWLRKACWGLLAWSVFSSLSVFPHSMSYFNELAGGPENGPKHLIDASIDWGQDLYFLADWCEAHPEAQPLQAALTTPLDPKFAGIEYTKAPVDPRSAGLRPRSKHTTLGPVPGWYAVSVTKLYGHEANYAYLLDFPKTDMIGYSIYIYHLTQEQVDDWNRRHGFVRQSDQTGPQPEESTG